MQRLLNMEINDEENDFFLITISGEKLSTRISFNPQIKQLNFFDQNKLSRFLKRNEYQFRKILHIKRPETYKIGFSLSFVITDKKDVAAFNNLNNIIALNRLNGANEISILKTGLVDLPEIFTDGSYSTKRNKGGFAVIIKSVAGDYTLWAYETDEKSISLIELLAAIKGLELTKTMQRVRIITDSQYVRKGLTEWIVNWKRNNWLTASGTKVKNIKHWKKYEDLSKNRYIEFKYVKAHSQHFENTMADLYAKDMADK